MISVFFCIFLVLIVLMVISDVNGQFCLMDKVTERGEGLGLIF
jgi:hypothetical protein